ncbi:MAG TPA: hypothetical protein VE710_07435 [Candidatus Bathyarchaeia archaeon]|nr:hypothetical protein [Candidatus Bathyarchaeia archaeon]
MIEGILIIIGFAVFTPVFGIVLFLTIFAYFISKKAWLTGLISLPISIVLYMLAYRNHTGLLDMSVDFQFLMAVAATCTSLFLAWLLRTIARSIGKKIEGQHKNAS